MPSVVQNAVHSISGIFIPVGVKIALQGPRGQFFFVLVKKFFLSQPQRLQTLHPSGGVKNRRKFFRKKFGGYQKVRTFAVPLERKGVSEGLHEGPEEEKRDH